MILVSVHVGTNSVCNIYFWVNAVLEPFVFWLDDARWLTLLHGFAVALFLLFPKELFLRLLSKDFDFYIYL